MYPFKTQSKHKIVSMWVVNFSIANVLYQKTPINILIMAVKGKDGGNQAKFPPMKTSNL